MIAAPALPVEPATINSLPKSPLCASASRSGIVAETRSLSSRIASAANFSISSRVFQCLSARGRRRNGAGKHELADLPQSVGAGEFRANRLAHQSAGVRRDAGRYVDGAFGDTDRVEQFDRFFVHSDEVGL